MVRALYLGGGLALLAGAVAACSGGSSVTPQPSNSGQGGQPPLSQTVTFTVSVPKAPPGSSELRHTRGSTVYVSPKTGSIGIQLATVDGNALLVAPPASIGNVPTSCIASGSGCTVTIKGVAAAIGADAFAVTTYVGANGTGAVVSQGLVPVTVTAGENGAKVGGTNLSLGGFVASLGMTVTPSTLELGEPADATVIVVAQDATGAVIVGNTQFAVPITLTASPSPQFQAIGDGQQGASITLLGPESPKAPARLRYNGSLQVVGGSIAATSQNSSGATITARQNVVVEIKPSPTPSGQVSDLYVLNGEDNSLLEYPANPNPTTTPRRSFGGGKTIGCKPQLAGAPSVGYAALGTSGLAFDGSGNALVGNGSACASLKAKETFYALAPNAVGTATPSAIYVSGDGTVQTFVGMAYDANQQYLQASDASLNVYLYAYRLTGGSANQAAALGETGGAPTCLELPAASGCGNDMILPNTFVTYSINTTTQDGQTFALDAAGNAYYPAIESTLWQFVLLQLPLASEPASGPALANNVWIDGITPYSQNYGPADANRLSNYPLALAIDGNLLFVLNYPTQQAIYVGSQRTPPFYPPAAICNANPNATPSPSEDGSLCQDGTPHEFLTAYDLSKLTGSGPVPLQPVLIVGGDAFPGNQAAGAPFADRLAVGGGNIYIAEPAGTSCTASCLGSLGKTPIGQIAIYPESLTGRHINDGSSKPATVIQGANIKFPTGVVLGPQGTGLGSDMRKR